MPNLDSRVTGALYGGAIGDAIGAPVEGLRREQILELLGPVKDFIPPTRQVDGQWTFCQRPDAKGDGRITDDTLMVEALIAAYAEHVDHLRRHGGRMGPRPPTGSSPWFPPWPC